ncbi:MAG: type II toxin-antitoxin system VapC family toxin [Syntrophomonadaceae bacterium]|nr:type II toxin-antitoxin system VapC family toxin [Syntrophomonadaceae bacterium]
MIDPVRLSTRYVVDTNIIIYTLKGMREAVQALEQLEEDALEVYYSTIVEAELFSFHELTTEQKVRIRGILDLGEIVDVDSEVALKAAELRALSKKNYQRKLKLPDAIVVATAFLYSATLITRNVDDFKYLRDYGLRLWNPFEQYE